jgi:6-phosphogluconolactonase (cycloisomerase 2 family)
MKFYGIPRSDLTLKQMKSFTRIVVLVVTFGLFYGAHAISAAIGASQSGAVYVMSNKAKANSVLVYERAQDGTLTFLQESPTHGLGTGVTQDPLMSQGALAMCPSGKVLLAVNPGSGELTAFQVATTGLLFGSKVLSGGAFPVSVTVNGATVYVLNQLGTPNISGFTVDDSGQLHAIPNSTRDLAGGALALPAQVSFTPDGGQLLVAEKGTNLIDIFQLLSNGQTTGPIARLSSGKTPFGFAFGPSGTVVVSEAESRLPLKGTTSSYQLSAGGTLEPVSSRIPDNQTAACWVAITGDTAWVVNTLTSIISSYQLGGSGELSLLNSIAASTGVATTPTDEAASSDGNFLYVLKSATGDIAAYRINGSTLIPLSSEVGLPLSIAGIVVR